MPARSKVNGEATPDCPGAPLRRARLVEASFIRLIDQLAAVEAGQTVHVLGKV
jgi:hypothetical protein